MALETGASLVPVYCFGANDLYDHPQHELVRRWQLWLVQKARTLIVPYWGVLPLLPYKVPVTVVVGAPMEVHKVENPTNEQVDKLHEDYMAALIALYDTHKKELGYGDRPLIIT